MNRIQVLSVVLVALPLAIAGCGGDDEATGPRGERDADGVEGPALVLEQQDRDRISELAAQYIAALRDQDLERAHSQLRSDVPEKAVERAISTVRDEGFEFIAVTAIEPNDDGATATVELRDKDGEVAIRYMEFRRDGDRWYVYSPQLKPNA